jgi:hypothetical protein
MAYMKYITFLVILIFKDSLTNGNMPYLSISMKMCQWVIWGGKEKVALGKMEKLTCN